MLTCVRSTHTLDDVIFSFLLRRYYKCISGGVSFFPATHVKGWLLWGIGMLIFNCLGYLMVTEAYRHGAFVCVLAALCRMPERVHVCT